VASLQAAGNRRASAVAKAVRRKVNVVAATLRKASVALAMLREANAVPAMPGKVKNCRVAWVMLRSQPATVRVVRVRENRPAHSNHRQGAFMAPLLFLLPASR